MSVLTVLGEARARWVSLENPNVSLGGATLTEILGGGGKTWTGERVGEREFYEYSAWWAGVSMICGTVGKLPIKLYAQRDDGGKDEERGHPAWGVVHDRPNPEVTSAIGYKESKQAGLLLRGNAFAEIVRNGRGEVTELWPIPNDRLALKRNDRGDAYWEFQPPTGKPVRIPFDRILNICGLGGNGILGWSVLSLARETIALGLGTQEYAARFFGNSARLSGFISHPNHLKKETAKKLKAQWEAAYTGLDNAHRVAVLEEDMKWHQMGATAEDSQFLESRQFNVIDVARWLNMPPHKLRAMERMTFNNVEEQNLEYMDDTIDPWLIRWEQALTAQLLTERERQAGLFFEFVRNAQLRASTEKRGQFYQTRFNTGSITPNQIRGLENENPLPGGDTAYIPLNMIPLGQAENLSVDERARLLSAGLGGEVETRTLPTREQRSPQLRLRIIASFRPLLLDQLLRLIRGEMRNVRRGLKENGSRSEFSAFLDAYYTSEFPDFARSVVQPVFTAFGSAIGAAAAEEIAQEAADAVSETFADTYATNFTARHAATSRKTLQAVARDLDRDLSEAIEERMTLWEEGAAETAPRHRQMMLRESVKFSSGLTKTVFALGGITALVWRAIGDTCPYCTALDGRRVGIRQNFINEGEAFQPDGADVPLQPAYSIGHPPAHRGCDCTIIAGV